MEPPSRQRLLTWAFCTRAILTKACYSSGQQSKGSFSVSTWAVIIILAIRRVDSEEKKFRKPESNPRPRVNETSRQPLKQSRQKKYFASFWRLLLFFAFWVEKAKSNIDEKNPRISPPRYLPALEMTASDFDLNLVVRHILQKIAKSWGKKEVALFGRSVVL